MKNATNAQRLAKRHSTQKENAQNRRSSKENAKNGHSGAVTRTKPTPVHTAPTTNNGVEATTSNTTRTGVTTSEAMEVDAHSSSSEDLVEGGDASLPIRLRGKHFKVSTIDIGPGE